MTNVLLKLLDGDMFFWYNVFMMKIHRLECNACHYRWTISDYFLDDGNEIFCANCGSEDYRLDAVDDVEEYAPLKNPIGWSDNG